MKLLAKALKKALLSSVCLLLLFSFTVTVALANAAEVELIDLLELALKENSQVKDALIELEKATVNWQASTGQIKPQIGIDGNFIRAYMPLQVYQDKTIDYWNAEVAAKLSTYLPTGTQLNLVGKWSQLELIDQPDFEFDEKITYTLSVSQPLFRKINTLPMWQAINLNQRGIQQKEIELLKVKRDVALLIIENYLTAWEKQEQLDSVKRRLSWASQELARVEQQYELGNATKLDYLESKLRYQELQLELETAAINLERALDELKRNVGVEDLVIKLTALPDLASLSALGLKGVNPELELAKLAVAANQYNYEVAKADNQWQSRLNGSYNKDGTWQVNLNVSIPLFDSQIAKHKLKSSSLQLEQSTANLERATEAFQRQQKQLADELGQLKERLRLAEESLAVAELRKETVELRAELGAVSFSEKYTVVEQWENAYLRLIALQKQNQLLQIQAWFLQ